MTIEDYEVKDGGIWLPKRELERLFKYYREKGYANYRLYIEDGVTPCLYESGKEHAKADLLWDLISCIENLE